jgi:hypothetical protein
MIGQLLDMLKRWVLHERDTESVIEALEERATYTHNELLLNLRLDRKDRMDDGVILSDYKGSRKSADSSWFGLHPHEPQLPLYAQVAQLGGVQVRELRFGIYQVPKPKWISISTTTILSLLPRSPWLLAELTAQGILTVDDLEAFYHHAKAPGLDRAPLFQRYLDSLKGTLSTLFDGFLQGDPLLDPLPQPRKEGRRNVEDLVCNTCDFQDVCRIHEYLRDSGAGAEPESDLAGEGGEGEDS